MAGIPASVPASVNVLQERSNTKALARTVSDNKALAQQQLQQQQQHGIDGRHPRASTRTATSTAGIPVRHYADAQAQVPRAAAQYNAGRVPDAEPHSEDDSTSAVQHPHRRESTRSWSMRPQATDFLRFSGLQSLHCPIHPVEAVSFLLRSAKFSAACVDHRAALQSADSFPVPVKQSCMLREAQCMQAIQSESSASGRNHRGTALGRRSSYAQSVTGFHRNMHRGASLSPHVS